MPLLDVCDIVVEKLLSSEKVRTIPSYANARAPLSKTSTTRNEVNSPKVQGQINGLSQYEYPWGDRDRTLLHPQSQGSGLRCQAVTVVTGLQSQLQGKPIFFIATQQPRYDVSVSKIH
jgi:hypothetical protein